MKTQRQRLLEADKDKKWAQVRYSHLVVNDRSLPNFDNTNLWNGENEASTWTTNGVRGQALPMPYYNGYTVGDEYTTPVEPLLAYIGFMKTITLQMSAAGMLVSAGTATALSHFFNSLVIDKLFMTYFVKAFASSALPGDIAMFISEFGARIAAYSHAGLSLTPILSGAILFLGMGLLAGNTYKDVYKAWNEFEKDSIECQHRADTEVDEDGNPLWSGYTVKYNIKYGNTTTTQAGQMKLIQHHHLIRGRYRSKAYGDSSVLYTFEWSKSIRMIPA